MTDALKPQAFALLVNLADVNRWLSDAAAGDMLEYHRGYLAADRWLGWGDGRYGERVVLGHVAERMWGQAEAGAVHLVQVRRDVGLYSYVAVRTRRASV